eukprot:gene24228-9827_t
MGAATPFITDEQAPFPFVGATSATVPNTVRARNEYRSVVATRRQDGRASKFRRWDEEAERELQARREKERNRMLRMAMKFERLKVLQEAEKCLEKSRCDLCALVKAEAFGLGHKNWRGRFCSRCWSMRSERLSINRHFGQIPEDADLDWPLPPIPFSPYGHVASAEWPVPWEGASAVRDLKYAPRDSMSSMDPTLLQELHLHRSLYEEPMLPDGDTLQEWERILDPKKRLQPQDQPMEEELGLSTDVNSRRSHADGIADEVLNALRDGDPRKLAQVVDDDMLKRLERLLLSGQGAKVMDDDMLKRFERLLLSGQGANVLTALRDGDPHKLAQAVDDDMLKRLERLLLSGLGAKVLDVGADASPSPLNQRLRPQTSPATARSPPQTSSATASSSPLNQRLRPQTSPATARSPPKEMNQRPASALPHSATSQQSPLSRTQPKKQQQDQRRPLSTTPEEPSTSSQGQQRDFSREPSFGDNATSPGVDSVDLAASGISSAPPTPSARAPSTVGGVRARAPATYIQPGGVNASRPSAGAGTGGGAGGGAGAGGGVASKGGRIESDIPGSEAGIEDALKDAEWMLCFGNTQEERTRALYVGTQLRQALADLQRMHRIERRTKVKGP